MKDPIEDALEKLAPKELPPAVMARLTAARPQPGSSRAGRLWRGWLGPLLAGACTTVVALAWMKSADPVEGPKGPALVTATPIERNDYLVAARNVGTLVGPDDRPYRVMEIEWLERDTLQVDAGGPSIRFETKRREVIPVAMEVF